MWDSETDSDLAVEQYDAEDDLNAYGSPVFQTVDKVQENLPIEGTTSTRTQASFLHFKEVSWHDVNCASVLIVDGVYNHIFAFWTLITTDLKKNEYSPLPPPPPN